MFIEIANESFEDLVRRVNQSATLAADDRNWDRHKKKRSYGRGEKVAERCYPLQKMDEVKCNQRS